MLTRLRDRAHNWRTNRRLSSVSRGVMEERLTYLVPERLQLIEDCAKEVRRRKVPGDFAEAGVALGGSAIVLARLMGSGRSFHGYDVFGMIPPPTDADPGEAHERYGVIASGESVGIGGTGTYYGYLPDLFERVSTSFARYGVPVDGERINLHKGLFEDTLFPAAPIALAHVDSDWYDPVRLCLERMGPQVSPGGFLVFDDYFDYGGCRAAVDEFLAAHDDFRLARSAANVAVQRVR